MLDDKSCSFVVDSQLLRRGRPAYDGIGAALRSICQSNISTNGMLWEGRFRSCLVQQDNYVLACYRYIEMNPVRAGMVAHPGDYRWTSYRANAQGELSGFISPHAVYSELGSGTA